MSGGSVTNGFKFTGKETGYTDTSVFFPTRSIDGSYVIAGYWSGTADGDDGWRMLLRYDGDWSSEWYSGMQGSAFLVRPVLK